MERRLNRGFLRNQFGGLIFGGAYFRNFTVTSRRFYWFPREMMFEKTRSSNKSSVWNGDITEGFLRYRCWGLIFGGAYFRNFTVTSRRFYRFPREMTFERTRSCNTSSVWNFCAPVLRHPFMGKSVVLSRHVGCFFRQD